eukprot:COSAG02_NODE_984_length_15467_cov_20.165799_8_plen_110_part_00
MLIERVLIERVSLTPAEARWDSIPKYTSALVVLTRRGGDFTQWTNFQTSPALDRRVVPELLRVPDVFVYAVPPYGTAERSLYRFVPDGRCGWRHPHAQLMCSGSSCCCY